MNDWADRQRELQSQSTAGGTVQPGPDLELTRRQFIQALGASAVGAVMFTGCQAPTNEFVAQSRVLLAEDLASAYENWYATTCRGCSAGCGAIIRVVAGRAKKLEGNPDLPLNWGRSCARAQASVQEEYHPDRLQQPLLRTGQRGSGEFIPLSWEQAIDRLAVQLRLIQQQGPLSQVALLTQPIGAHQALVVEGFARALGAEWLTLDPLPQTPVHRAVATVLGAPRLPEFDIEHARYILSFGADFLSTWLSPVHYGVEYGVFRQGYYRPERFEPRFQGGEPRGYLVHVEPRFSMTAANADEWVWIQPGREGLLALSLAQVILSEGLADPAGARAFGDPAVLDTFRPELVAEATGVEASRIRRIAREFAANRPSLAFAGGPAAAQTNGTENVAAVLALNLLVGAVGREGGVLLNPEPYLGLPTTRLPADLPSWQNLAERLRAGQVQAVMVHDANPVYGLPAALGFGEALLQAPFVVSFSSFMDETTALADLILPSHLPLESWGDSVPDPAPGFRVLTLQQPVVQPFYATRSFYDALLVLGLELGGPTVGALPWAAFKDVLRDGARQLFRQVTPGATDEAAFERFWVQLLQRGGWWDQPPPVPTEAQAPTGPLNLAWTEPVFAGAEEAFPYYLVPFSHNTLDDGRGAHLPWLQAAPDPVTTVVWQSWVEVNPRLAAALEVGEGDAVEVETPYGRVELPVYVNPAASPDVLAIPMGWGHAFLGRWAARRGVNPMALLAPLIDQQTEALAYAATRARVRRVGRSTQLPKFEGTVPARQLPGAEVLKVTRG